MAKKKFSKSNVLWFIRTRPYTPVADLRRRFRLEAEDMTTLCEPTGKIYVGLPEREAHMIHQLWREGKIGLELSPRVTARVVEGVYPLPSSDKTGEVDELAAGPDDADLAEGPEAEDARESRQGGVTEDGSSWF